MRNKLICFSILLLSSFAQAGDLGAGIILLGPTGFSANYFVNKNNSIDGAMSWGLNDDDQNVYLHSTYLWHRRDLLHLDGVNLDLFFGGGGRLVAWEDPPGKKHESETRLGIRGAGGVGYTFRDPRIELFGELSITMDVIPETDADFNIGIGGRFYF